MSASLERIIPILRSPRSGEPLVPDGGGLSTEDGRETYPIRDGIPILIEDGAGAFAVADFTGAPPPRRTLRSRLAGLVDRALPLNSRNLAARDHLAWLAAELEGRTEQQLVLIVGGSVAGEGMEAILEADGLEVVETDVAFGPRTDLICDGHSLPFADATFDAVVCQAVLEHVADPPRVVEEIWRVLGADGLVYSEIPFMQQVHEGAYDFTRYTLIGHRRLYRRFVRLAAGPSGGPGMALSWSLVYFARALAGRRALLGDALAAAMRLATFWLKYFDRFLLRAPAGADAAAGTFFLGRKAKAALSDREIIEEAGAASGGYMLERG